MKCWRIYPVFFLSLILLWQSSCQSGSEELPILPADSMVVILTDLHIVAGGIQRQARPQAARDQAIHDMYDQVLELRQIDRAVFWESYAHYLERPEEFDSIYSRIIENLNKKLPDAEIRARRQREENLQPPDPAAPQTFKGKF